jgi:hypothetical protein
LQVELGRNGRGALSVAFRGSGTDTFWRLGELLVGDYRATPLERPLEGLDQMYWRLRLADGAIVMLCEDTMVGVSLDAEDGSAEPSLRSLANELGDRELERKPIQEVRRALQPALASFPMREATREEIQAVAGQAILAGVLIGALAGSFVRDMAMVAAAAIAFASWRQLKRTTTRGIRPFARDLGIAGILGIFSSIALAVRALFQLWWTSAR